MRPVTCFFSQRFVVTEPQWVNPRQDWTLGHIHCYCVANNGEGGTIGREEQVPCPRVLLRATTRKNPPVDRQPPERIGDPVLIKEALTRIVRSKLRPSSRPSLTWRRNAGTDLEMSLNWPSATATVSRNEARKSPVWFVTWGNNSRGACCGRRQCKQAGWMTRSCADCRTVVEKSQLLLAPKDRQ